MLTAPVTLLPGAQDAITFNMLLTACCKLGQNAKLFEFLELMRSLRIVPTASMVTSLMSSFKGEPAALEQALCALQQQA